MISPARMTALRVLVSCRTNQSWADAALKAQISRDTLSGADAALCSRIVYGVLHTGHINMNFCGCESVYSFLFGNITQILQFFFRNFHRIGYTSGVSGNIINPATYTGII